MGAAPTDSSCSFTLPQVLLGPASISQSFSSVLLFLWLLGFPYSHSRGSHPPPPPRNPLLAPKPSCSQQDREGGTVGGGGSVACRARAHSSFQQPPVLRESGLSPLVKDPSVSQPEEALSTLTPSLHLSVPPPFPCLPHSLLLSCHAVTPPLHPLQATRAGIVEEPGGDCPQEV